jgi:hypothetical protein
MIGVAAVQMSSQEKEADGLAGITATGSPCSA